MKMIHGLKHDVIYNVTQHVNGEAMGRDFDNIRLESLAAAEHLHQFLAKNKRLAQNMGWKVDTMLSELKATIESLRDV